MQTVELNTRLRKVEWLRGEPGYFIRGYISRQRAMRGYGQILTAGTA